MSDKGEEHSKISSSDLDYAIRNGELERVRMYIERGVDVNIPSFTEFCPLAQACICGREEIMNELLNAGADPNQYMPAMLMAAEQRTLTLSMLRCLISHGADVNLRDNRGMTILHMLACGEFKDTDDNILSAVRIVLENGASFYARDNADRTPLYQACRHENIDLVKCFVAEGADVNLRGAVASCNIGIFDMLLNAGANRHLTPDALVSPCCQNGHAMIAKILDTCDVDINMPLDNCNGMTILHFDAECDITSHGETVRVLLDRGADVRAVSDTGDTALHYAVIQCGFNKIRHLLSYNAPLNIKNNKNQTPLAKLSRCLVKSYTQSREPRAYRRYYAVFHKAGLLTFKILVIAGAKVTADVEHNLNQFHIKHPEAQLPDYEIRSTRSLKEMCRFVIRGTIPVPVDVSLCKLPIPKLLQEYLNFPEFDPLVEDYLKIMSPINDN